MKEKDNHPGIYRLSFGRGKWLDFVYDNEDIKIKSEANAILDSIKIEASENNRLYYSFLKMNKQYKSKTELLQLVLARYPADDPYYNFTKSTAAQLQNEYSDFTNNISQKEPKSFVARSIKSSQLPIVDFTQPLDKQLLFLKSHALDRVDYNDDELINSDVFSNKSIEYLTYYRNPQLPKELLEKEFMSAVDTILNKAKTNVLVYQHIAEYLIDGFKQFGFEKCISYILDNYVIKDSLCLDEGQGSSIQKMIEQKKMLPVGAVVPDFILPDTSGNAISPKKVNAGKLIILFYSVACPHCQSMMPRLTDFMKSQKGKGVEVLAVSLDTDKNEWLNFVRKNNLAWINVNDPRGWGGAVASDYYIYATPTMFLVDKEKKIISKPITIEELQKSF
jgi:peroxiredoxin